MLKKFVFQRTHDTDLLLLRIIQILVKEENSIFHLCPLQNRKCISGMYKIHNESSFIQDTNFTIHCPLTLSNYL